MPVWSHMNILFTTITKILALIIRSHIPPPPASCPPPQLYRFSNLERLSLLNTHIFLVSIIGATLNHIPLIIGVHTKKKSNRLTVARLSANEPTSTRGPNTHSYTYRDYKGTSSKRSYIARLRGKAWKPAGTNDFGVVPQKLSPETSSECVANNTKAVREPNFSPLFFWVTGTHILSFSFSLSHSQGPTSFLLLSCWRPKPQSLASHGSKSCFHFSSPRPPRLLTCFFQPDFLGPGGRYYFVWLVWVSVWSYALL